MPMIVLMIVTLNTASAEKTPRLVLQITIDGLRADLLDRYDNNFGSGGFNYLLENGVVYENARYLHANTETIVGHTTLATGATPAIHGMVGNVWYHADDGELGYNIEDAEAPLIPTRKVSAKGAQVDPAQLRARSSGRSPRSMLAPTLSDTLASATGGQAKIFGISGKDRSAVAMAGKTGTAYWYSTNTGDFQTSGYYMENYPQWVQDWNGQRKAEQLGNSEWNLMLEGEQYLFIEQDDRPYEVDLKGYGRVFPHAFGPSEHPLFFTRVLVSPHGDELTLDFAKALVRAEAVGQDAVTDYLSISFSSVDAVNHFFGPSSLENEDVVLRLDRTLERLFLFIDENIGLDSTLIVLSADHGMADMPEYASEMGRDAGRLYGDELLAAARAISLEKFGNENLVKDFFRPYLYLDKEAIAGMDQTGDDVAQQIAAELKKIPGVGGVFTGRNIAEGNTSGAAAAVRHNHHPLRSGDIYVFQKPHWFMFDRGPVAAMHGSPWEYDQHVPIMFVGPGIKAQRVKRAVHPVDVAPTLSALLKLPPPSAAQGTALKEVLEN